MLSVAPESMSKGSPSSLSRASGCVGGGVESSMVNVYSDETHDVMTSTW